MRHFSSQEKFDLKCQEIVGDLDLIDSNDFDFEDVELLQPKVKIEDIDEGDPNDQELDLDQYIKQEASPGNDSINYSQPLFNYDLIPDFGVPANVDEDYDATQDWPESPKSHQKKTPKGKKFVNNSRIFYNYFRYQF